MIAIRYLCWLRNICVIAHNIHGAWVINRVLLLVLVSVCNYGCIVFFSIFIGSTVRWNVRSINLRVIVFLWFVIIFIILQELGELTLKFHWILLLWIDWLLHCPLLKLDKLKLWMCTYFRILWWPQRLFPKESILLLPHGYHLIQVLFLLLQRWQINKVWLVSYSVFLNTHRIDNEALLLFLCIRYTLTFPLFLEVIIEFLVDFEKLICPHHLIMLYDPRIFIYQENGIDVRILLLAHTIILIRLILEAIWAIMQGILLQFAIATLIEVLLWWNFICDSVIWIIIACV